MVKIIFFNFSAFQKKKKLQENVFDYLYEDNTAFCDFSTEMKRKLERLKSKKEFAASPAPLPLS